jgi:hypothetical protein
MTHTPSRLVNGIILSGQGLLVTFDDNVKVQLVWKLINGMLTLTADGSACPAELAAEIINGVEKCNRGTSLWSHLFGSSSDHLSASSLSQIGDALTPNTWTTLLFDNSIAESQHHVNGNIPGLRVEDDGNIIIPPGEFYIDASLLAHRSGAGGADGIIASIQALNTLTNVEIPFSFHQGTTPALNTAPISLRTSFFLDVNGESEFHFKIRIRSDTNRCELGADPGRVPAGSTNHAGFINIFRTG